MVQRDKFIKAMRCAASCVTVVTTDGPSGRHGATVSAFSSVSADPPSVLICLNANSRIARLVQANEVFCVNILPDGRWDVAEVFAGRVDSDTQERFKGAHLLSVRHSAPVLADATAAFSCDLVKTMRHGSHTIAIGLVVDVHGMGGAPLAYHQGGYHRLQQHEVSMRF